MLQEKKEKSIKMSKPEMSDLLLFFTTVLFYEISLTL